MRLEESKCFLTSFLSFLKFDNIESNSLREWSALANSDSVADFNVAESWRDVNADCSMSFLISVILLDEMNIVSSNDESVSHLGRENDSFEDLSSNANIACEGAFLINICSLDCLFWSSETKSDVFIVSNASFSSAFNKLSVLEDSSLLFECLLSL